MILNIFIYVLTPKLLLFYLQNLLYILQRTHKQEFRMIDDVCIKYLFTLFIESYFKNILKISFNLKTVLYDHPLNT